MRHDPVAVLRAVTTPAVPVLDDHTHRRLRAVTDELLATRAEIGLEELDRFEQTRERGLAVDHDRLAALHAGRTVVVTGGTGCIGAEVTRQVAAYGPGRLVVLSRGRHTAGQPHPAAEYRRVDLRDAGAVRDVLTEVQPDLVYHLAAQHDPGLAERLVTETLATNVGGTANVIAACTELSELRDAQDPLRLACASTGKALRPFTPDIYAGSKKATEWLLRYACTDAGAPSRLPLSAVRFTHVVDNSIIHRRLAQWCADGEPIRLHDPGSMFYLQSAREAAELLLTSALDARPGELALSAIRDLGWPVALLDLAIGMLARTGSTSVLQCCGYEAGYEKRPYPALYDPLVSGERSPLFSALEAFRLQDAPSSPAVDLLRAPAAGCSPAGEAVFDIAARAVAGQGADELRDRVASCGWALLRDWLGTLGDDELDRHVLLLGVHERDLEEADDLRIRQCVLDEARRRGRRTAAPIAAAGHERRSPVRPPQAWELSPTA